MTVTRKGTPVTMPEFINELKAIGIEEYDSYCLVNILNQVPEYEPLVLDFKGITVTIHDHDDYMHVVVDAAPIKIGNAYSIEKSQIKTLWRC